MKSKDGYPIHPFAEIFPLHDGPPLWELREDIKANGLLEPIVLWKGQVIDGRRRQVCCIANGIEPQYVQFKGSEEKALAFVVSKNLKRRHLGEHERAMVAAKIANMPKGGDRRSEDFKPPIGGLKTTAEAAEMLDVSQRAVERAKVITEHGTPDLQDAVADGTVSISDAAAVARAEPAVQDAAVSAVREGSAPTAAKAAGTNGMPVRTRREKPAKKPRIGAELFVWREFDKHLAVVAKGPNELAAAYEGEKQSQEYGECVEALKVFAASWKRWEKRLRKESA